MATYVLPPGAWLSGSALNPGIGGKGGNAVLNPGIGGNTVLNPGIGGNTKLDPGIGGKKPRLVGASGTTPALLAEALDRSRARVMRQQDPRREADKSNVLAAEDDALWRWGDEPRALAVLADLGWRFAVSDACLWYLDKANKSGQSVAFEQSISFAKIPSTEKWYAGQVDKVLRAAVEREERLPEILSQADDFMAFFSNLLGLYPAVAPITFELLSIAQRWVTPITMALKNQLAARRPDASSTRVLPVIPTPPHGSLPSGHATVAALLSRLLAALVFGKTDGRSEEVTVDFHHPKVLQLDRLARRIAFNRVVAGVHFPIDSRAGHALGLQLAAHFIGLATNSAQPIEYPMEFDLDKDEVLDEVGRPKELEPRDVLPQEGLAESAVLGIVWRAARRELAQLGVQP